jgi:hypothetical protein
MAKNIFRFVIALVGGFILGQLLVIPIGIIIDKVYGYEVTGNNSPISVPNIIYIISIGFLSGYFAGGIYKKRGMVIGGILQMLPLFIIIGISIVLNKDIMKVFNSSNRVDVASWAWISLIPGIIGGYVGEKTFVTAWIKNKSLAIFGKGENQMRKIFGGIFRVLGGIALLIFGLWGLIIELAIVNQAAGFWGVVIGIVILPVTFVAAPWYALVAWGNWFPLEIVYGGGILTAVLLGLGSVVAGD